MCYLNQTGFEVELPLDIKRKISMLKFISAEKRWFTFEEISQHIKISTKTISKDLLMITDILPSTWKIKVQKGYGVQLIMPINASIEEIITYFFRTSIKYKILEILFNFDNVTVACTADKLYVQSYVVTKSLKKIEKDLSHYNLKLQRKPLRIVGNEWEILLMYTELYLKASLYSEWPFPCEKSSILKFIDNAESCMERHFYISSKRFASYYLATLLTRKQQGHNNDWKDLFSSLHTSNFYIISKQLEPLEQRFNLSFSEADKMIITILFNSLHYTYIDADKIKKQDMTTLKEGKVAIYTLVKELITMLFHTLEDSFIKEKQFICVLIEHFRKKIYLLHLHSHIKRIETVDIQYIKRKYLKTFLQVKKVYYDWIQKHKIATYVPDEEIVNIVLYIESFRITYNNTAKKAIIISKEGEAWEQYISAFLKGEFGDKVELITKNVKNILKENQNPPEKIDFIVSTIPLDLEYYPVIMIQPIITERDLQNIRNFINI
ncbi:helix-turn-helix domain-containing protein [Bacillus thuringiensis]|uniref:Helix-turn-helix domain-containing protein n=1 Tax=Bacillus thuringiensis TaxID=1428 RepID=A0AAW9GIT1_BACTU|nr:helix-turn-helix domain-containing protein [Bacillus thuringiensis]MDY0854357.1 helix-turn-helix domain-containing protein [Bacillus thuringiensis]MDY4393653.1 helix-turn-helix domain-containing protein [Bacillus thuringiensis]